MHVDLGQTERLARRPGTNGASRNDSKSLLHKFCFFTRTLHVPRRDTDIVTEKMLRLGVDRTVGKTRDTKEAEGKEGGLCVLVAPPAWRMPCR